MEFVLNDMSIAVFALACGIALVAGVVKGMVGFAMPMILISGLSSVMAPELALAGLIVPTLVTNGMQSLRQGTDAAVASIRKFRVFLGAGFVMLLVSAQFVRVLPGDVMLLLIGAPVTVFAVIQLAGLRLHLKAASARLEVLIGGFAGAIGGLSGIWGPPTVLYLTALNTEKTEQIRVQGVIYGLGAAALFLAHIASGVLGWATFLFSLSLVPPAVVGMWIGGHIHDRIDQASFRKATLIVLLLAALNLVRRAVIG